ncbi:MAG: hypothetical protein ACREVS_23140 [Burkholderiales bacterium]
MSNPYTPPGSPVNDPPNARRRSALGAIALGFGVDILATMVVSTLLSVVAGVSLAAGGSSPEETAALLDRSAGWLLVGMLGGLGCTVLGGYVAARFANHSEYANAFAVGVASLVFGEAVLIAFSQDLPLWLRLAGDLAVVPAALLGGHLRMLQKRGAAAA